MAIRNCVGARYVPKFADPVEWQSNTSYEAMVIVTYNNSGYTSKIPVPPTVGNPAENPVYWALTGNYNAQVEQYRQETENYKTQIEEYRQETANIKTNLTSHINNKENPHSVTKAQVGLGNVDNVSKANILQSVYPVGSIYLSANSKSPAELFGGTWERIKDCFLLAAGDTYAAGSTGGEAQHKLTEAELPQISGYFALHGQENGTDIYKANDHCTGVPVKNKYRDIPTVVDGADSVSNIGFAFGGDQPHNNMPPYLAVYAWKRIA